MSVHEREKWLMTHTWRPSVPARLVNAFVGLGFAALGTWLLLDGEPDSLKDTALFVGGDVLAVVLVALMLFRWRLVLLDDELLMVFLRTRRLAVRDVVDARYDARSGLTFVREDRTEEASMAVRHGGWRRRPDTVTLADLVARDVLCAGARARGEDPPVDYRLPPVTGLRKAVVEGGVWAFIVSLVIGS